MFTRGLRGLQLSYRTCIGGRRAFGNTHAAGFRHQGFVNGFFMNMAGHDHGAARRDDDEDS